MSLRHQLRADDNIDTAFRDLVQFGSHGLDVGDEVAGEHHGARLGKETSSLFLQAFHAGTDGGERFLRRALRTDMRARHREPAMVTDKALAETMIHEPRIADVAREAAAAGPA